MEIRYQSVTAENLAGYGSIPIAFTVASQFRVSPVENGIGGLLLVEEAIDAPYLKDYDGFDAERPARWRDTFETSRWIVLAAYDGKHRIGGAVVAWDTPGVDMLEGRHDLAVLWDLRIHPDHRRRGVGQQLFDAAAEWARKQDCHELKIETQNINVPACRFYARQGCVLRTIRHNAYPDLPDEAQLLWYKNL